MKRSIFFICLLVAASVAPGQKEAKVREDIKRLEAHLLLHADDLDARYDLGMAYNTLGVQGDEEAPEIAAQLFKSVYDDDPSRLDARAFYGSAVVLQAKYASIFSKLDLVEKGFEILDDTVTRAPENIVVRLTRAANSAKTPGFLGRHDLADEDFEWLDKCIRGQHENFEPGFLRAYYVYRGEWALRNDDPKAVDYFIEANRIDAASHLDERVEDGLEDARDEWPKRYARSIQNG